MVQGTGDLPALDELDDRYRAGSTPTRGSTRLALMEGVDETVARYFESAAWVWDLAIDHTTAPASEGGVYVFAL